MLCKMCKMGNLSVDSCRPRRALSPRLCDRSDPSELLVDSFSPAPCRCQTHPMCTRKYTLYTYRMTDKTTNILISFNVHYVHLGRHTPDTHGSPARPGYCLDEMTVSVGSSKFQPCSAFSPGSFIIITCKIATHSLKRRKYAHRPYTCTLSS